ncbi:MAG TPA: YidC/Oxa1 family membrane protein insertase, partial [Allosphingosinicella sp.]|nr:YidC/Oxa1 family membrane protein insertase [Allosphingosinicella sp.]
LNPQATDPMQRQIFALMPWVLMFVMSSFAAGLQLYWVTNNILSIAQQRLLYARHPSMRQPPGAVIEGGPAPPPTPPPPPPPATRSGKRRPRAR